MRWLAELPKARPASGPRRAASKGSGCAELARRIPLVADGSERLSPAAAEHLRTCPACRSELAGYRHLLEVLRSLRSEHLVPTKPFVAEEAWATIAEHLRERARSGEHWRVAGAAAVALVVLGGAAVARAARQARPLAGATATA